MKSAHSSSMQQRTEVQISTVPLDFALVPAVWKSKWSETSVEAHRGVHAGTHTVSALLRYRANGIKKHPGQDVRYVVVDDGARRPDRVRLPFEEIEGYDAEVYSRELIRAAESIVSPLGWEREDIRRYLREHEDVALTAFE